MTFRPSRADAIVAVLLALALAAAMLLWLYYPVIPRSILGWVLLFVIGIPTWFFLEWLGARVLATRVFSRMGRAARIALAVPVLILLMIIAAYVIHLGQTVIARS
jgi:hypothetical protein